MTIKIMPFIVAPKINSKSLLIADMIEEDVQNELTYWGIYLDDKQVSYTSSRDSAQKTKDWIEKWLTKN